ncbi:MAG: RsbRD N-terminal domain-containing protein [Gemmatimonadota bacterium]
MSKPPGAPAPTRYFSIAPQIRLGRYIAGHAKKWVKEWLETVQQDPSTPAYASYGDTDELLRDTEALYHYLATWLRHGEWDPRIDPHYQRIGRDRRREGFPIAQVIAAILLAKRALWEKLVENKPLSMALELEVTRAISRFYDRAIYNTVIGYEETPGEDLDASVAGRARRKEGGGA